MKAQGVLLEAVRRGDYEAPSWVPVDWPEAGVTLLVGAHALRARSPLSGAMVRIPSSYRDAVAIENSLGWIAPTAEVSDLIWRAAANHLSPHRMPTEGMDTMETVEAYDERVERDLAGREGLTADEGKDWIVSERNGFSIKGVPAATTYGWRYPNGQIIQGSGPAWKAPPHNADHDDYSQVLRPIQRYARRLGDPSAEAIDLVDVYRARGLPESVLSPFLGGSLGGGGGGGGGGVGAGAPARVHSSSMGGGATASFAPAGGLVLLGLVAAGVLWLRSRG